MSMENGILLSIVVPAYNAEGTLDYCLESLIDTKLEGKYEIIVVNDGSTDGTMAVLSLWKEKYPNVIKVVSTPNQGAPMARNEGCNVAGGQWVYFCDADDYLARGALFEILAFASSYPEDLNMVGFNIAHISDAVKLDDFSGIKGVSFYGSNMDFFLNGLYWAVWCFIYRKEFLEKTAPFRNIRVSEDTLFNVEHLLNGGEFKVLMLDADVYRYVAVPTSLTRLISIPIEKSWMYINTHIQLYKMYNGWAECNRESRPEVYRRLKWVMAKNLPNLFTRVLRAKLTLKDLKKIKYEFKGCGAIPTTEYIGISNEIRSFLLLHPFWMYLSERLVKIKR